MVSANSGEARSQSTAANRVGAEHYIPPLLALGLLARIAGARPMRRCRALTAPVDRSAFRDVCGRFVTGVCVVTSFGSDGPAGMTANAVSSLSLEPPLMLVCFDRESRTLAAARHSRRFAIHFLRHDQEPIAATFASKQPEEEKFAGLAWTERSGTPVLDDCLGAIACELKELRDGGDHEIGVGEAVEVWGSHGDPLVFYRGDYVALTGREPAPREVDEALEP